MAAFMGRTELGIQEFGRSVVVPDNPKARLMYYLNCMCVVLDLSDEPNLARLKNYGRHYELSESETDYLITLCLLLSPDELNGKVIFQDDSMCDDCDNNFFKINAVRHNLVVSNSIVIGGRTRAVLKIMAFKRQWLISNWATPIQHFSERLARIAAGASRTANARSTSARPSSDSESGCVLL